MKAEYKKRAIHRSKIIRGQFDALIEAIEKDTYCVDILTQSLAIQKSLAALNKLVLENHLRTHVTDMMASGDQTKQAKAIEELLNLYELNNIRGRN